VGSRLWMESLDGAGAGRAGFMGADTRRGGRLFLVTPGLNECWRPSSVRVRGQP